MLPRAVKSALNQPGVDVEIILIDDASIDGGETRALIQHYNDSYDNVKAVYRKQNGRIAAALNSGIEAATGRYIIRLDSDDWFERGALAKMKATLDAHEAIGFVYGARKYYGRRSDVYKPAPFTREAFDFHNASGYAYMFRRVFIDKGLRFEALGTFNGAVIDLEDWQFALKLLGVGAVGLSMPDTLVLHYTFRWGGTWQELVTNKDAALDILKQKFPSVKAVEL